MRHEWSDAVLSRIIACEKKISDSSRRISFEEKNVSDMAFCNSLPNNICSEIEKKDEKTFDLPSSHESPLISLFISNNDGEENSTHQEVHVPDANELLLGDLICDMSIVDSSGKLWRLKNSDGVTRIGSGGYSEVYKGYSDSPSGGVNTEKKVFGAVKVCKLERALPNVSSTYNFVLSREIAMMEFVVSESLKLQMDGHYSNGKVFSVDVLRLLKEGFTHTIGFYGFYLSETEGIGSHLSLPFPLLFITMPLLSPSCSLSSVLRTLSGDITEISASYYSFVKGVRHCVRHIVLSLAALHGAGIIHCDIKPANVMVVSENSAALSPSLIWDSVLIEGARCVLIDFGSAILEERSSAMGALDTTLEAMGHAAPKNLSVTQQNTFSESFGANGVGTIPYMSPEACRRAIILSSSNQGCSASDTSQLRITTASDVWSLGITVAELLTGRLPWRPLELSCPSIILAGHGRPSSGIVPLWKETLQDIIPQKRSGTDLSESSIYEHCYDFVSQCLCDDPKVRPDALTLLSHPFLA